MDEEQRHTFEQFMRIAGTSDGDHAIWCLDVSDWDIDEAFEIFYSNTTTEEEDQEHFEEIYNRYKDPNVDMILADGIALLCEDLQVDPQDLVTLVISWHMKAAAMCEFSNKEFVTGLKSLEIDSVEMFRQKVPFLRAELKDEQKFRQIYNYAFGWAKEKDQKFLPLDTTLEMWQLLFAERQWPLFDHWCKFLQEKNITAISEDLWSQTLEFARTMDSKLSNYDPEGSWPCLIDEFVDHLTETGIVQMA